MNLKDILIELALTLKRLAHVEDVSGKPFIINNRKFIPISQRFRIGGVGQGGGGGFVWNRPIAITEEIGEGIYQHHHIHDETLRAVIGITIAALLFRMVIGLVLKRR